MGDVRVPPALRVRDPQVLAPLIGLTVVDDEEPGVQRLRCGRGFRYVDANGQTIRPPERQRFVDLAVPPAWNAVWLSPMDKGYLQATGRDAADRKQYRYHDRYRRLRDQQKFERLRYFPRALPQLRRSTEWGLSTDPGSESYAVAAVLRLLDVGLVRVGNEASARTNHHGATTLHADHVDADDAYVMLSYTAKSGKERTIVIEDDQLVEVLQHLADPDAERLFWYHDAEGHERRITADIVNRTIAELVGPAFTAKDFRTWGGSRAAFEARASGAATLEAVDAAAGVLGNTRSVARASYVHPAVLDADQEEIVRHWARSRSSRRMSRGDSALAKLLRSTPAMALLHPRDE